MTYSLQQSICTDGEMKAESSVKDFSALYSLSFSDGQGTIRGSKRGLNNENREEMFVTQLSQYLPCYV